jgi:4-hydroxy-3-polyprenylbenzoate decarboxylase
VNKGGKEMVFNDLREWMDGMEKMGKLLRISNADRDKEMGTIFEIFYRQVGKKLNLLFDDIPDFPKGYRSLFSSYDDPEIIRATMNLPLTENYSPPDVVRCYKDKVKDVPEIPYKVVKTGPVMENTMEGDDVNLLKFPAPLLTEFDGGRYMGTDNGVIMKDPDEGWVNIGTYRMQEQDDKSISLFISPGKQGGGIRNKYFDRNEPCPVAVTLGHSPLLSLVFGTETPYGVCEYDYAGGLRGEPIEVIEGPVTGLPIPAHAEIVIEGYCTKGDNAPEGPYPEWPDYYGSSSRAEPVMRVKAIYFRNDPILLVSHHVRANCYFRSLVRSALHWSELENLGISDIKGIWRYEEAGTREFNVISIKQRYYGHAKQVLYLFSQVPAGAYSGRWDIVVDEDIDPTNYQDVIWALATRCDPATDIEIMKRARSTPLDPMVFDKEKNYYNSRALVDACIPYEYKDVFPRPIGASKEYLEETYNKWIHLFT